MRNGIVYTAVLVLLMSCSAKRYLPEGDRYFAGHKFEYNTDDEQVSKAIKNQLENDIKPEPVVKVFWSRPSVWLHGVVGETKKNKGFKHFLKYRLGDKPQYISNINIERNIDFVENKLVGEGFFNATVRARIDSSKNEAQIVYMIDQRQSYRYDSLFFCKEPDQVCGVIDSIITASGIHKGAVFSTGKLEANRKAIGNHFRTDGYYYFRPAFIKYQVDSTGGGHTVKVKTIVQEDLENSLLQRYSIGSIILDISRKDGVKDTIPGKITIITDRRNPYLKPYKITPFIALQPASKFSLADQRQTIGQLNKLDVFEYINLRFDTDTSAGSYLLNATILTSPKKKQSVSTEISVATNSNNLTGPGLIFEYNNRNVFRGAEKFRFTASGRYETQFATSGRGQALFEIDLDASLLVPHVSGILARRNQSAGNVPRTKYGISYRILNQPNFYTQSAFGANYGYEWSVGTTHFHNLSLIGFDYLRLLRSSPELDELLENNVFFRESFENQVIVGPNYRYSFAQPRNSAKTLRYGFTGTIGLAGNMLYAGNAIFDNSESEDREPYTFFGVPFSQFVRMQQDHRLYINTSKTTELVFRANIGVGLSYLNSNTLPFASQFFVGGPSSMRAFLPRSIGPGTYFNPEQDVNGFFDQTGDFLAEFNIENRFGLGGFFEGAFFVDIGNVWLQEENPARPGGKFEWGNAINELAVAAGTGIRMDLSVVLIRLDVAFPLRLPYLPEGERWVVDQISISQRWRNDNLLWNLGIGYPF
jgi:outer membrane protein assembly factor BamA